MLATPSILVYAHPVQHISTQLQAIAEAVVLRENIVVVRSMDQLIRILRQPFNGVVAAIILAETDEELRDLINHKELLLRIPFILILPDQEKDTITKGHALRPRYLTYADSDLSDVRDVFRRIVNKANIAWQ